MEWQGPPESFGLTFIFIIIINNNAYIAFWCIPGFFALLNHEAVHQQAR